MHVQSLSGQSLCLVPGHRRTACSKLLTAGARASSPVHRRALSPCAALRTGPTGLDVLDPETGKAYRPTSRGGWGIISNELKEKQVRFVAPQEVAFAREKGLAIIDVRPAKEYQSGHIEGSVNVQYYRWIEGWNLWKFARRFMFTFFGVVGTEPNPEFVHEIMEVADPRKGVVLACNLGGHLEEYGPSPHGYQTRSLMAAYELFLNGYEDVRVVKGGIGEWRRQERTLVEEK